MSKEKQIFKKVNAVLAALRSFNNVLVVKGQEFNYSKIEPLYKALEKEISDQGFVIIKQSQAPVPARKAKDILADLAKGERLTPELLDEIKRLQKSK